MHTSFFLAVCLPPPSSSAAKTEAMLECDVPELLKVAMLVLQI